MPTAQGVEYFESELLPGKPMFRCSKLSATLQVATCAGLWAEANGNAKPERLNRCMACEIGAAHSGVANPARNPLRGTETCARCYRQDLRLIGDFICVGCQNRSYEWVKGRNARGRPPVKHPPLASRRVRYRVAGEARSLERPLTASSIEMVVDLLRRSDSRVEFGLGKGGVRWKVDS